jgi:hypothetical protein
MSEFWDYFLGTVVGWDHLTPQGIRFGIASFLALFLLVWGTGSEGALNLICMVAAGILVAQAVSFGVH